MKRAWPVLAVLVVLAAAGFAVWKRGGGPSSSGGAGGRAVVVERVVPHGAVAVALTRNLGKTGEKLKLVQALKVVGFAGQLQGFETGAAFGDALVAQLGIDIRSADGLAAAGLDGARGAAVMLLFSENPVLALPVGDESKFRAAMAKLADQRLGAKVTIDKKVGPITVTGFQRKDGEKPLLAYVVTHTYALVVDTRGLDDLAALATLPESDSLQDDREYSTELTAVKGRENDLIVWLPSGSPALMLSPVMNVFTTLTLTPAGLELDASARTKDDGTRFAAFVPQQADDDLGFLPRDAFFVGRFKGDPSKLGPWTAELLGAKLKRTLFDWGFDVQTLAYDQLKPGSVFSLSLSEAPPLGAGMPDLDIRRTNPFAYAQLAGVARVRSPDAVKPAFDKLMEVAPKFGAQIELRTRDDGQAAYLTSWSQGEGVHFAPRGDVVFFGSPVGRLQDLVKSDGKGGAPVEGLPDDALSLVLDVRKLSASLRALPDNTWGVGGFAMKTAAARWLDAIDDVQRVTFSMALREKRVRFHASLQLAPAK